MSGAAEGPFFAQEIGDIIRLGELSWQVYNFGWAPEFPASPAVHPRWHLESLFDIIGDYEATLDKCYKLIEDNNRFHETTGPIRTLECDLLTRIYDDICKRIGERDALDMRNHREIHLVEIPSDILAELDAEFKLYPSFAVGGYLSLRNMTDSFIMSFDQYIQHFAPGLTIEQKTPPVFEYISLLKCQFLIQKIRASLELANVPEEEPPPIFDVYSKQL
ncbi:hypothetical protein C7999DRAFT_36131 [Corynascus novoguineensis]|uniref:Uncharacterized protein n=1 Tax=Corynascus novoguineensis TaxID=1126955 RepID=A0AAN7CK07_9PEZI|nr:hypothetical protein C7999DRAFT_36131 [Corynascus novoguineensis]